jgi:hypothetical protein
MFCGLGLEGLPTCGLALGVRHLILPLLENATELSIGTDWHQNSDQNYDNLGNKLHDFVFVVV